MSLGESGWIVFVGGDRVPIVLQPGIYAIEEIV